MSEADAGGLRKAPGGAGRKTRLQGIAFALILLASAGLYFTASREAPAGTWVWLGVEAAGMLLALWIS